MAGAWLVCLGLHVHALLHEGAQDRVDLEPARPGPTAPPGCKPLGLRRADRPSDPVLRVSSRLTVDGLRRTCSAIAGLLSPARCRSAITIRSS